MFVEADAIRATAVERYAQSAMVSTGRFEIRNTSVDDTPLSGHLDYKARRDVGGGSVGVILVAASAVAYSFAGYFTRLIPLDVWTLLFWRGLFGGLAISLLIVIQYGRGTWAVVRAIGLQGLLVAAVGVAAACMYIAAFRHTTVADVSIIYATLPLLAACLAWLLLGERPGWRLVAASVVTLLGCAVMLAGAFGAGQLSGDLLALGMTLPWALVMVLIRGRRDVSMLPAVALSCFMLSAVTWPLATTGPLAALPLTKLALFGGLQLGLGLALLTLGMRRVSAGRAALIGLLDVPLAPIWVWLAFAETPPATTLIGGGVVLAAVLWHVATDPSDKPAAISAAHATPAPAVSGAP